MTERAATLGDAITHSGALPGLEIGLAVGAGVLLVCFTGGMAGFLFGAALCAGLGHLGEALGATVAVPEGALASGSLTVTVGGKPMARAGGDACALCAQDHAPSLVATGSGTVWVNGYPAARNGSQLACGASVAVGSGNVLVGGPTVAVAPVAPEIPPWVAPVLRGTELVGGLGSGVLMAGQVGALLLVRDGVEKAVLSGVALIIQYTAVAALAHHVGHDARTIAHEAGLGERAEIVSEFVATEAVQHIVPEIAGMRETVWPGGRGFQGSAGQAVLPEGTIVDRYTRVGADDGGTFVAPQGTPFEQRALPDSYLDGSYELRTYRVTQPIAVDAGASAPWFDQPGGGVQYEVPHRVSTLTQMGVLEEL